ncbi:LuxR C-terminal-related transcriptional regulator [Sinomonas sp. P47F7]|uniref:helix-turn-helix transcriptional regulator n=1 Tax=Sinomonas sp. P47F7 TaxID=3410987 RepID=UPI003BF583EA
MKSGFSPSGVPHAGLSATDQPAEFFRVASSCPSTFALGLGVHGTGKSVWSRQVLELAGQRGVRVAADPFEAAVPFAFADRLARAAGCPSGPTPSADAAVKTEIALDALARLQRKAGGRGHVCLILDDLQWADSESLQFTRYVVSRLAYFRSIVVVLGRPSAREVATSLEGPDSTAWALVREIPFEPLDAPQIRAHVAETSGRSISLRLAERIRERSGGLLTLIDACVSDAESAAPGEHWDWHVGFNGTLSPTLEMPPAAAESARHAVEICSVLSSPTPRAEVIDLAERLGMTVDLDAAIDSGVLIRRSDGTVVVRDSLLADEVASSLDRATATAILTTAAELTDDGLRRLELQLAATGSIGPALLDHVRVSAATAPAHRVDQSVRCLRRAAELCDAADRDEILLEACLLAVSHSATQLVLDLIPAMRHMPGSPVRDLALANALQISGHADAAQDVLGHLLAQPADFPDAPLVRAEAALLAAVTRMVREDYSGVGPILDLASKCVDELPDRSPQDPRLLPLYRPLDLRLRAAALALVNTARQGSAAEMPAALAALTKLTGSAPPSPDLVDALTCLAGVHVRRGEITVSIALLERALRVALVAGGGWTLGQARCLLILAYWLLGRYDDARSLLSMAAMTMLDSIDISVRPLVHALRSLMAATEGDAERAEASLLAMDAARVPQYSSGGPLFELVARAEVARGRGDFERILEVLSPSTLASAGLLSHGIVAYRIEALAALGQAETADRELARFRSALEPGQALPYGDLDWLEGRVHEAFGLHAQAIRSYHRAASRTTFPLPAARARKALGRAQMAAGGTAAGSHNLRAARDALKELGAVPYWQIATQTLGEAPVTPRLLPADLSAREREVYRYARDGWTNSEIADELSISPATAAFHMRNILAKTGARSRRELP